jgi:hypothetical protein
MLKCTLLLALTSTLALFTGGCGGSKADARAPASIFRNTPSGTPHWVYLDVPRVALPLPSILVGEHQVISRGCWKSATPPTESASGAHSLVWEQSRQQQLDAAFKTALEKYLVEAKVDTGLLDAFKQSWKLDLQGVAFSAVDPSDIRPDFNNQLCTEAALEWFKTKRLVFTEGIKAKKISISITANTDQEQRAKLDLAIAKLNAEFHTKFERTASTEESLSIEATDAYVGVAGTSLVALSCSIEGSFDVAADTPVKLCDDRYEISISGAPVGDRYTLSVTPKRGSTGQFDLALGRQEMQQLGELRVVFAMVRKEGDKFRVDNLEILFVGPHA